jgi:ethanolamine-phosphate cytidylyltransferase
VSFTTTIQQVLISFGGVSQVQVHELVSPVDVIQTIVTVIVTLLCYHVLFGNRHWRRRRKLVKELNVAKKQLTFLEEKLRQPSSSRKKRKGRSSRNSNVSDDDDDDDDDYDDEDDDDNTEIRIFVEGAFDMFHFGHANAFRLARSLGTCLVVGVNSDESITQCKGAPLMNEQERLVMVEQCKFVDEVISGTPYIMSREYLDYIFDKYRVDYVVHGDDPCIVNGRDVYETAKAAGKFRTIPRTEGVSTTDIVGRMLLLTKEHHMSEATTTTTVNDDDDNDKNDDKTTAATNAAAAALGTKSKFLTTTRLIQLFSADLNKSPTPDMRVIYIDGSWDMFNPSHVALLKGAKEVRF